MEKLKEKREELGLSQTQIANLLDVHVNTYRLWEQGAGSPNEENKKKLEKALDIKAWQGGYYERVWSCIL